MNEQITKKIDEIFIGKPNSPEIINLKKDISFDCKKLYNQMLQSGFSEYIAVSECIDNLTKIQKIIDSETDIDKIKYLLGEEKILQDNIKNTTSSSTINEDYDQESIDKIIKLVEDAALESENLNQTDIKEQNDEIVYKIKENKTNSNKPKNTKNKLSREEKKKYFVSIFSFVSVITITAIVVFLLHYFNVFGA